MYAPSEMMLPLVSIENRPVEEPMHPVRYWPNVGFPLSPTDMTTWPAVTEALDVRKVTATTLPTLVALACHTVAPGMIDIASTVSDAVGDTDSYIVLNTVPSRANFTEFDWMIMVRLCPSVKFI